eukprot:m.66785 g.66785  ORF g.66785 m.66785 type:complete len:670 (+) comp23724_c0_seq2:176-2185(+)
MSAVGKLPLSANPIFQPQKEIVDANSDAESNDLNRTRSYMDIEMHDIQLDSTVSTPAIEIPQVAAIPIATTSTTLTATPKSNPPTIQPTVASKSREHVAMLEREIQSFQPKPTTTKTETKKSKSMFGCCGGASKPEVHYVGIAQSEIEQFKQSLLKILRKVEQAWAAEVGLISEDLKTQHQQYVKVLIAHHVDELKNKETHHEHVVGTLSRKNSSIIQQLEEEVVSVTNTQQEHVTLIEQKQKEAEDLRITLAAQASEAEAVAARSKALKDKEDELSQQLEQAHAKRAEFEKNVSTTAKAKREFDKKMKLEFESLDQQRATLEEQVLQQVTDARKTFLGLQKTEINARNDLKKSIETEQRLRKAGEMQYTAREQELIAKFKADHQRELTSLKSQILQSQTMQEQAEVKAQEDIAAYKARQQETEEKLKTLEVANNQIETENKSDPVEVTAKVEEAVAQKTLELETDFNARVQTEVSKTTQKIETDFEARVASEVASKLKAMEEATAQKIEDEVSKRLSANTKEQTQELKIIEATNKINAAQRNHLALKDQYEWLSNLAAEKEILGEEYHPDKAPGKKIPSKSLKAFLQQVTDDAEVMLQATITKESTIPKGKNAKLYLEYKATDVIDVLYVIDPPAGLWVGKNSSGTIGYVRTTDFNINADTIRKAIDC